MLNNVSNWSFRPVTRQRIVDTNPMISLTATSHHSICQKMADAEKDEAKNLQVEFEWVLRDEVHPILKQLRLILIECAHRFPVPLYENEGKKTEKFTLMAPHDQLKCSVTLTGDSITQADINFKLQKAPNQVQRTSITQDSPWKLQQVQDAANHLQQAINHIDNVDETYHFKYIMNAIGLYKVSRTLNRVIVALLRTTKFVCMRLKTAICILLIWEYSNFRFQFYRTSDEVLHIVGDILGALQRGRTSLVIPKKKPIDELMKGRNMKSLAPNLPEDLAISFYLQSHKLIIAVYQLTNIQGTMKFDSCQAEFSVPWLNEVLVLFTVGLQLCQQLKDKISVFSLYKDFTVGSRSPSALSY